MAGSYPQAGIEGSDASGDPVTVSQVNGGEQ
jgi:hypothetical protein